MSDNMAMKTIDSSYADKTYMVVSAVSISGKESTSAVINEDFSLNEKSMMYRGTLNHDERLIVDMPLAKENQPCNATGWLRDRKYYFENIQSRFPAAISEQNKRRIEDGNNIIVDDQYCEIFPQYSEYHGQLLHHHHIGDGRQAIAIPACLHIDWIGIHSAEKIMGIDVAAKHYSDYVKNELKHNPNSSDEEINANYVEYVKQNNIIHKPIENKLEELLPRLEESSNSSLKKIMELEKQLSALEVSKGKVDGISGNIGQINTTDNSIEVFCDSSKTGTSHRENQEEQSINRSQENKISYYRY